MIIDTETYWIKEVNRYKTQSPKTQIVIAGSQRSSNNHLLRLLRKNYGASKSWNTYTISREGLIYQHYDPKYHTDFLGVKEGDKQSISIVLENMGRLFKTSDDEYMNWINERCELDNVIEKNWLGYKFWEMFPDVQIRSTVDLCLKLCEEFGIQKNVMEFRSYHKDTSKVRGIVFRSNYIEDSTDINPLFDISEFTALIKSTEPEQ